MHTRGGPRLPGRSISLGRHDSYRSVMSEHRSRERQRDKRRMCVRVCVRVRQSCDKCAHVRVCVCVRVRCVRLPARARGKI